MKRVFIAGLLCFTLCGCSAMQGVIRTTGEIVGLSHEAPVVELPPQPSPALQEAWREEAAVCWMRLLALADQTQEVRDDLIAKCAGLLVAAHGRPAYIPETVDEIAATVAEGERLQATHRAALDADRVSRTKAAVTSQTSRWSLHSGALGSLVLWKCIAGSTALLAAWALIKKVLIKLAASSTVGSVGVLLSTMTPNAKDDAKKILSEAQTPRAQALVKSIKAGV